MALRAVRYLRISKDKENRQEGIERQEIDTRRRCEQRGWIEVCEPLVDNDEGAYDNKDRPNYGRLVKMVQNGEVDVVVSYHTDRLWRTVLEQQLFLVVAKECGLKLISAETDVDPDSTDDVTTQTMAAIFAWRESADKSRRYRRMHLGLAEKGKWSGGGRVFGLKYDKDRKEVTVVEQEAEAIRTAVAHVLAGGSVRHVARTWNESGLLTTTGREWDTSGVKRLLVRPSIAGLRDYKGKVIGRASWPAIISEEEHEKVVTKLNDPLRRTNNGVTARKHWASGFLFCGICGHRLMAQVETKKGISNRYYVCKKTRSMKACGGVSMKAEPLERFLREHLFARVLLGDFLNAFAAEDNASPSEDFTTELHDLQEKKERANRAYMAGAFDEHELARAKAVIDAEIESVHARIAVATGRKVLADIPTTYDELVSTWDRLGLDWQRDLVDAFITRVLISKANNGPHTRPESRVAISWRSEREPEALPTALAS